MLGIEDKLCFDNIEYIDALDDEVDVTDETKEIEDTLKQDEKLCCDDNDLIDPLDTEEYETDEATDIAELLGIDDKSCCEDDEWMDALDDEGVLTDEATVKDELLEIDEESLYDKDEENDPCDDEGVLTDEAIVVDKVLLLFNMNDDVSRKDETVLKEEILEKSEDCEEPPGFEYIYAMDDEVDVTNEAKGIEDILKTDNTLCCDDTKLTDRPDDEKGETDETK